MLKSRPNDNAIWCFSTTPLSIEDEKENKKLFKESLTKADNVPHID